MSDQLIINKLRQVVNSINDNIELDQLKSNLNKHICILTFQAKKQHKAITTIDYIKMNGIDLTIRSYIDRVDDQQINSCLCDVVAFLQAKISERRIYNQYDKCCRVKMDITDDHQLLCHICGSITPLKETCVSKNEIYSNGKLNNKANMTDKHLTMKHILLSNKSIPTDDQEKIINRIRKDHPNTADIKLIHVTNNYVRNILSLLNMSKYNPSINDFIINVFDKQLPSFSEQEENQINNTLKDVILEYNKHHKNVIYYPFFLYKVIELYHHEDKAKMMIIDFVHMQKACTIIKLDSIYRDICNRIGLKFMKTKCFNY
jgi:hypothetical protein